MERKPTDAAHRRGQATAQTFPVRDRLALEIEPGITPLMRAVRQLGPNRIRYLGSAPRTSNGSLITS